MKNFLGALALVIAIPAVGQTAPAADPHAGHAQPARSTQAAPAVDPHAGHAGIDHAQMMKKCTDPSASTEVKAHCAAMMKMHGPQVPASPKPKTEHEGHAH
jgi:hypothetical protein